MSNYAGKSYKQVWGHGQDYYDFNGRHIGKSERHLMDKGYDYYDAFGRYIGKSYKHTFGKGSDYYDAGNNYIGKSYKQYFGKGHDFYDAYGRMIGQSQKHVFSKGYDYYGYMMIKVMLDRRYYMDMSGIRPETPGILGNAENKMGNVLARIVRFFKDFGKCFGFHSSEPKIDTSNHKEGIQSANEKGKLENHHSFNRITQERPKGVKAVTVRTPLQEKLLQRKKVEATLDKSTPKLICSKGLTKVI